MDDDTLLTLMLLSTAIPFLLLFAWRGEKEDVLPEDDSSARKCERQKWRNPSDAYNDLVSFFYRKDFRKLKKVRSFFAKIFGTAFILVVVSIFASPIFEKVVKGSALKGYKTVSGTHLLRVYDRCRKEVGEEYIITTYFVWHSLLIFEKFSEDYGWILLLVGACAIPFFILCYLGPRTATINKDLKELFEGGER